MNNEMIAQIFAEMTKVIMRNTASSVYSTIKTIKSSRDKDKTINELESIINDLIADKSELERIVNALENELVSQKISDENIEFIIESVIPKIEELTKNDPKQKSYIDTVKSLFSRDTLQVMQLIGFNYRKAIGDPLTNICATYINNIGKNQEIDLAKEMMELSKDKDSYDRFIQISKPGEYKQ